MRGSDPPAFPGAECEGLCFILHLVRTTRHELCFGETTTFRQFFPLALLGSISARGFIEIFVFVVEMTAEQSRFAPNSDGASADF